jgi:hypothetical protein
MMTPPGTASGHELGMRLAAAGVAVLAGHTYRAWSLVGRLLRSIAVRS